MRKVKEVLLAEDLIDYDYKEEDRFKLNHTAHYGFIRSLCSRSLTSSVKELLEKRRGFENFVQVGIGGSALGASASLSFLKGGFFNLLEGKKYFALDNLDPERLALIFSFDLDKTLFHVVSKSGTTTETLVQFFVIMDRVGVKRENFIITTSKGSFLDRLGEKLGIERFYIPDEVVGRFSVFTPVGLLALGFFGFDIDAFVEGGKNGVRAYRNGWSFPNRLVEFTIGNYIAGKEMLVIFPYKDRLFGIGEWIRQLWAESLGKEGKGQTPVLALGVKDQHSQLQLYQDGKKDKAFLFIDMPSCCNFEVKNDYGAALFDRIDTATLMDIEKRSTKEALRSSGIPVCEIFIKKADEFTLGNFLISFMIATAKAGEVLGVNPFDQPGVELSKRFTREALKNA